MLIDGIKFFGESTIDNMAVGGGTTLPASGPDVNEGELFYLKGSGLHVYNGSTWSKVQVGNDAVVPYDIAGSIFGKPTAPSLVFRFVANRAFTIPAAMTGSRASTSTVSTGAVVLNVYKNGAVFGTINFAAGAANGTFTAAQASSFVAGDLLTVGFPTADATFGDAQFTFATTLA